MKNFIFKVQRFSIENYNDNSLVSGTSDGENIDSRGNNVTIMGLGGSDTIWNRGSTVLADGGADNDWLCAEVNTSKVTLQGGDGDDTLWAFSENNSMIGGAGNDFFYSGYGYSNGSLASGSSGDNNTIIGGTGDDSISFSNGTSGAAKNNVIQYAKGDGDDSIWGFSSDDTLEITSGRYTTLKSGSDLIVKVGTGYITLKGAADIAKVGTNIKGLFVGKDITSSTNNTILSGSSSADYIWNNGDNVVMNGLSGNDTLGTKGNKITINAGAGDDSVGINSAARNIKIYCDSGDDYINNWGSNVTIYGGEGDDSISLNEKARNIKIYCDSGDDYINSWGSNATIYGGAGNDSIYLASNYASKNIVNGGEGNDSICGAGKRSHIKGDAGADYIHLYVESTNTTVTGGADNDTIKSYSSGKVTYVYNSGDGNDIIDGINANDTIKIGGGSYTTVKSDSDIVVKVGSGKITLKNAVGTKFKIVGNALPTGLKLNGTTLTATNKFTASSINLAKYSGVKKFDGSAMIKAVKITGNSLSNSIIGGSKADTIMSGAGNDTLKGNGGADLFIHTAGNDIISDYAAGDKISVSGSYTGAVSGNDVILTTSKGTLKILNGANKNLTVNGKTQIFGNIILNVTNSSNDMVDLSNYKSYSHINATTRTKSVELVGNSKNNSIIGGSAADTLFGGEGNDTLKGGTGADKFLHSLGDDVITDYAANDKIYLIDTDIASSKFYVDDLIWTTDNGTLTIKNGLKKKITYYDSKNTPHIIDYQNISYSKNFTVLTANKNFAGEKIDLSAYAETVKKVNAAKVSDNIQIIGNSKNNSLRGGKGSDTISGDKGDDTLTGGAGQDIFEYTAGNDFITDYKAGEDKIRLSGTSITDIDVGDNDIVFTTSKGTLTLMNGAGKKITIIDSSGKEIEQRYSANIAEILADNSIGDFENYTEKTSAENLITFAK